MHTSNFVGNSYIPGHFLSPGSYTFGQVARIQLYTCHHLEHPWLGRHFLLFRLLAKLLTHGAQSCLGAWSLLHGEFGCLHTHLPCGLAGRLHDLLYLLHRVCSSKLSPDLIFWLARKWLSDFIFGDVLVSAISNHEVVWVRIRRLLLNTSPEHANFNNWRPHEPPDFLPFRQPWALLNTPT